MKRRRMNLREYIEVIDEILASDNRAIRSTMSRNDPQSALQVLTVYGTVSGRLKACTGCLM